MKRLCLILVLSAVAAGCSSGDDARSPADPAEIRFQLAGDPEEIVSTSRS